MSVVNDARPQPLNDLLEAVRRADLGDPTAIVLSNQPQAATQFTIGRNKSLYVDPTAALFWAPVPKRLMRSLRKSKDFTGRSARRLDRRVSVIG